MKKQTVKCVVSGIELMLGDLLVVIRADGEKWYAHPWELKCWLDDEPVMQPLFRQKFCHSLMVEQLTILCPQLRDFVEQVWRCGRLEELWAAAARFDRRFHRKLIAVAEQILRDELGKRGD